MERNGTEKYIRSIAEYRSISVAAESLGISQPALSSALKKKEAELGAKLFDRSKQPLELTEAGRAYLEYVERAEQLRGEMEKRLADIEGVQTGELKVGGAVFFNIAYMPKAIAAFLDKYPGVDFEIVDRKVPELTAMALKGEVDVFITPIADDPERFVYEELAEEKVYIAVPEDLAVNDVLKAKQVAHASAPAPDASDTSASSTGVDASARALSRAEFAALCENTFIVLKPDQSIGQRMEAIFREYGVRPKRTITAEQTMTTLALTNAGVGISLVTESSVRSSGLSSLPKLYTGSGENFSRQIYVAYPKNKYLSRSAEEFIKILKDVNND
ncbi:MAG: LysR family transcriptional regulator [Firmicutes bacterium]|nr:LysR family transcriptional regulator [Bacillota bacterium]